MTPRSTTLVVDPMALGNILLSMDAITREQLRNALEVQSRAKPVPESDMLLGSTLVAMGALTSDELAMALEIQRKAKELNLMEANLLVLEYHQKRAERAVTRVDGTLAMLEGTLGAADDDDDLWRR